MTNKDTLDMLEQTINSLFLTVEPQKQADFLGELAEIIQKNLIKK